MENSILTMTERDARTEDVNSVPDMLPLENEFENLPQPRSIKLNPSTTLISSKIISDDRSDGSGVRKSEETVPDSIRLENKSRYHPETRSNMVQSVASCLSRPSKQVSGKKCEKSCGLQYGISGEFVQTVVEQQKVKVSKSHIKPQIFDDPDDQKYFCHMLEDVMVKTFLSDDEQKIFRKSLEGMRMNYLEILERQKNNMFYCPTSFNFSSRIGEKESCVPDALDKMKSSLELNPNLTRKETQKLKKIRDHLQKLRPELAEQEFVDALACFFYNTRGIFIHSLQFDGHLKVLTNKAREYRKQNKSIGFVLTDFEKKLAEQLNIPSQTLVDTADTIVTHLLTKPKASNQTRINGNTTGWKITGEVINYETTPNQDHKIDIEEVVEVIEEVSEEGKLIMKRSLPSKKRNRFFKDHTFPNLIHKNSFISQFR